LLRLLLRTNAATRYAVWLATLVLVVMAVPVHYWLTFHNDVEESGRGALPAEAKIGRPIRALAAQAAPVGAQPFASSRPGNPHGQNWNITALPSPSLSSPEAVPPGISDLGPGISWAGHEDEASDATAYPAFGQVLSGVLQPIAWNVESSA